MSSGVGLGVGLGVGTTLGTACPFAATSSAAPTAAPISCTTRLGPKPGQERIWPMVRPPSGAASVACFASSTRTGEGNDRAVAPESQLASAGTTASSRCGSRVSIVCGVTPPSIAVRIASRASGSTGSGDDASCRGRIAVGCPGTASNAASRSRACTGSASGNANTSQNTDSEVCFNDSSNATAICWHGIQTPTPDDAPPRRGGESLRMLLTWRRRPPRCALKGPGGEARRAAACARLATTQRHFSDLGADI